MIFFVCLFCNLSEFCFYHSSYYTQVIKKSQINNEAFCLEKWDSCDLLFVLVVSEGILIIVQAQILLLLL